MDEADPQIVNAARSLYFVMATVSWMACVRANYWYLRKHHAANELLIVVWRSPATRLAGSPWLYAIVLLALAPNLIRELHWATSTAFALVAASLLISLFQLLQLRPATVDEEGSILNAIPSVTGKLQLWYRCLHVNCIIFSCVLVLLGLRILEPGLRSWTNG